MKGQFLLFFTLAVSLAVIEVSGRSCKACGFGEGADYCSDCLPQAYEAKPVSPKEAGANKGLGFFPVEDSPCSCRKSKVQPVPLPQPKYNWKEKKNTPKCDNSPLIPAPDHLHDFSHEEEEYYSNSDSTGSDGRPLFPVDVVSRDIVNKMQENAAQSIPEEKLQYGFWKLPKEVVSYKTRSNIPEEKLYTVERRIVELKNPRKTVNCGSGVSDEITVDDEPNVQQYLSYSDLGFVPESAAGRKFITSCKHSNKKVHQPREISSEESFEEIHGKIIEAEDSNSEEDYKYKVKKNCGCGKTVKSSCGCNI